MMKYQDRTHIVLSQLNSRDNMWDLNHQGYRNKLWTGGFDYSWLIPTYIYFAPVFLYEGD